MYKVRGQCINDFDVKWRPDIQLYELTHIQGPPVPGDVYQAESVETSYGRAHSSDLVNWIPAAPSFGISDDPAAFDSKAIWTMQILDRADIIQSPDFANLPQKYRLMFYTGIGGDSDWTQQVGLAGYDFDEDRECWERFSDGKPVLSADPCYYQTEGRMAWRDPYVVYSDELRCFVMFIAAKDKNLPSHKNGCIAWATSHDLENWEVRPPIISPGKFDEMECPVSVKLGDFYDLLVSITDSWPENKDNTLRVHVWQSDTLTGGYQYQGVLTEHGAYAARVIADAQGHPLVLHTRWIERPGKDGKMVISRGYLADPLPLVQDPQGRLSLGAPITTAAPVRKSPNPPSIYFNAFRPSESETGS